MHISPQGQKTNNNKKARKIAPKAIKKSVYQYAYDTLINKCLMASYKQFMKINFTSSNIATDFAPIYCSTVLDVCGWPSQPKANVHFSHSHRTNKVMHSSRCCFHNPIL